MALLSRDRIFTALRTVVVLAPLAHPALVVAEADELMPQDIMTVTELDGGNPLDSTITYPASYFAHYDPVTALDMLNRIPGIDSVLNASIDSRRGLGAGSSSILIDGKRIAGKENSGNDVLSRIAAKQVDHVEIIRGSSAELDVRTAGPIVNVVMREGASRSSISAELKTVLYGNKLRPGGSLSVGGQRGDFNYLTSFSAEPYQERQVRRDYSVLADGSPNDQMVQVRQREQTDLEWAGNFGYRLGPRSQFQFNAFYRDNSNPHTIDRATTILRDEPTTRWQMEDRESDRNKWEVGGNFEHAFTGGQRLNMIFVANESTDDWFYERFNIEGANSYKVLYTGEDKVERERIVRTSFSAPLNDSQDVELGVEGAQTQLDKAFYLGLTRDLPQVDSFVEEMRYEPFVIHNWELGGGATLESTLIAEFSEITQDGVSYGRPAENAREFKFLKPKVDYRYDLNNSTQLRATVERYISQLSFANFSAGSNGNMDLDKNVSAGNPELEQEKSWRYEVNLEYRLADDAGVLNSRIFYYDIEDVIDKVAVSSDPDSLVSAPGNIGDGRNYGAELDANIRLYAFDMPDARLKLAALVKDSEVTDPFLNHMRRLSNQDRGNLKFGFRHDLPDLNLNYGLDYTYYLQDGKRRIDIEDIEEHWSDPDASLFVEKVAFRGVTIRLESSNLLDANSCYRRTRFEGATAGGVIEELEDYCYDYGRKVALKVKTTF